MYIYTQEVASKVLSEKSINAISLLCKCCHFDLIKVPAFLFLTCKIVYFLLNWKIYDAHNTLHYVVFSQARLRVIYQNKTQCNLILVECFLAGRGRGGWRYVTVALTPPATGRLLVLVV